MSGELKRIYPAQTYVLESGEKVSVSPVPFGKLTAFGEAVSSLMVKVAAIMQESATEGDWSSIDVGAIFTSAVEEVIELMMMVLSKDREWFDTITTADGLGLFNMILEQNMSEGTKKNIHAIAQTIKNQFLSTSLT